MTTPRQTTPRQDSLSQRSLRGTLWSLAAQGVMALAALLVFAMLGRMVSHAELGEYMLALVGVGAVQWLALNAYREPLIQAPELDDAPCSSVFWFSAGVASLLAAALLGAALWLDWRNAMPAAAACLPWLALKLFCDTLASVPMARCARAMRFPLLARINMAGSVLSSLLGITLLQAGHGVLAVAAAQGVASTCSLALLLACGGWWPARHFARRELALLRAYSPHVVLWQGVEALNLYLDRFLVGTRIGAQALGVYGFGRRLNDIVIEVLAGAVGNVALPTYASLQKDATALKRAYLRSMRIMSFVVFPVIGVLFAVADKLVPAVFGPDWVSAVPIYRCFLLLGVIQVIGILQAALIRSLGFANLWARYQLLQAAANIAVLWLVIDHGIFALAVGVVLRTSLIWLLAVKTCCRLLEMSMPAYLALFARPVLGAVLAGFVAAAALQLAGGVLPVVAIIAAVLAGAIAYLLATLLGMRPVAGDIFNLITHRA
ncbi:MAG: oligosaccharide flippase family protein [Rhodocyclaceae bacterium]